MKDSNIKRPILVLYLIKSFSIVLGLVLIWRGIWYLLDLLDLYFFAGTHLYSAIAGIIIGFLLLFLPDHDLKEIEKL